MSTSFLGGVVGGAFAGDANNLKSNSLNSIEGNATHVPFNYGQLLTLSSEAGYYKYLQVCFAATSIATRRFSNGAWSEWETLTVDYYAGSYESSTLEDWIKSAIRNLPFGKGCAVCVGPWANHAYGVRCFISRALYSNIDMTYSGYAIKYDDMTICFFTCTVASDKTISDYKSKTL